jgi:hypothetical protein
MSRGTTTNLGLPVYDEGDNPGAGSKTVSAGNVGLNAHPLIVDTALGTGHNADGTHKADVIDGPNLKTTAADASTIQLTGTPLKLNIKDDGVTGAKIAAAFADGSTLETSAATGSKTIRIKDAGVTKAKLAADVCDDSTIELDASNGLQVKDDGITAPKISHDNARTKVSFTCNIATSVGTDYATCSGAQLSATMGIPMPRAGSITKISVCDAGSLYTGTAAYGTKTFTEGQLLTVNWYDGDGLVTVKVIGTATTLQTSSDNSGTTPMLVVIEVEFDD